MEPFTDAVGLGAMSYYWLISTTTQYLNLSSALFLLEWGTDGVRGYRCGSDRSNIAHKLTLFIHHVFKGSGRFAARVLGRRHGNEKPYSLAELWQPSNCYHHNSDLLHASSCAIFIKAWNNEETIWNYYWSKQVSNGYQVIAFSIYAHTQSVPRNWKKRGWHK